MSLVYGNVSVYSRVIRLDCHVVRTVGKRRGVSGAITAGLVCGVLHLVKNEYQVQRIKYVARQQGRTSLQPAVSVDPTVSWPERLLGMLGFQKVSDDAYMQQMIKQRDIHLVRIKELEYEIEQERRRSIDNNPS